ncbi:MAG: YdaU family protein [Caldilinea sp.]|nr:YdaU family protein [Caldilinea sp.]MDW8442200.1 YdaU family protein [Caldilineaceae bacterium]
MSNGASTPQQPAISLSPKQTDVFPRGEKLSMSFAFMPLYTGDYLRDTRHLTPQKHGIYLLFLMHCWDQKGPLPTDENELAGIANCRSADEIESMRYVLGRYFIRMEDGWYNKRMTELIARYQTVRESRSKGGKNRAAKFAAPQRAQALLKHCSSTAQAPIYIKDISLTPVPFESSYEDSQGTGVGDRSFEPNENSALQHKEEEQENPTNPTTCKTQTEEDCAQQRAQAVLKQCSSTMQSNIESSLFPEESTPYVLPRCPYEEIVAMYHRLLPMLPRCEVLTDTRKGYMQARWRQVCADERLDYRQGLEWFEAFFAYVADSRFLTGRAPAAPGRKPFRASLDWLMRPENFAKVYEGRYNDEKAR